MKRVKIKNHQTGTWVDGVLNTDQVVYGIPIPLTGPADELLLTMTDGSVVTMLWSERALLHQYPTDRKEDIYGPA